MKKITDNQPTSEETFDEMCTRWSKINAQEEQQMLDNFNVPLFTEDKLYIHAFHFSNEDYPAKSYVTIDVALEKKDKPDTTIFMEESFYFWDMLCCIDENFHDEMEDLCEEFHHKGEEEFTITCTPSHPIEGHSFIMYKRPTEAGYIKEKNYAVKNSCVGVEDYYIIYNYEEKE